jgi:hypothetical protein
MKLGSVNVQRGGLGMILDIDQGNDAGKLPDAAVDLHPLDWSACTNAALSDPTLHAPCFNKARSG